MLLQVKVDFCNLTTYIFTLSGKIEGQPIAGRVVVSRWLSKFNFSILSMS